MNDSEIQDLLTTLVSQGEEHTQLLRSIDARLVDVIDGIAAISGGF